MKESVKMQEGLIRLFGMWSLSPAWALCMEEAQSATAAHITFEFPWETFLSVGHLLPTYKHHLKGGDTLNR